MLDLSRLSLDACNHASQNERLPLRVTLQVLFFEQLRLRTALLNRGPAVNVENSNLAGDGEGTGEGLMQEGGWVSLVRESGNMKVDMNEMRSRVRELEREFVSMKQEVMRVGRPRGLDPPSRAHTLLGCVHAPHSRDANLQKRPGSNIDIPERREILR